MWRSVGRVGERESGQKCHSSVFGAAKSLFVIQSLLLVHGHSVADPPSVGGPLGVLELGNVGLWGVAAGLVGIGQVISTPLMLRAGRCGNSRGQGLPEGVVWEVEDHL